MASTNTEKPTGKAEQKRQAPVKTPSKKEQPKAPVEQLKKEETKKQEENKVEENKVDKKPEDKKETKKKVEVKKTKKEEVKVVGKDLPISTKVGASICKFIKNKPINVAISDLQEVQKLKKAVPMKGEIPHRKGKMMSGRFPKKAAAEIEMQLKSLEGNANQHDIEEPIISRAIANIASRPLGKKGRVSKKRSHVTIWATDKSKLKKMKDKNKDKKTNKVKGEKK